MGLISYINKISRVTNKLWMSVLALTIAALILTKSFTGIIIGLWSLFFVLSLFFSINGFLLNYSFKKAVEDFESKGKPVRGLQGFDELEAALKGSAGQSYLITAASLISFLMYLLTSSNEDLIPSGLGPTLSLAMVFVAVSVMFLVEYPRDPSFTPGGLIGYYEPDVFPLLLDNLLSDVFLTYVDPATFMKVDEWSNSILELLKPEFEADEITTTRLERAREKVLLLAYLNYSNPRAFGDDVIERELKELFGEQNVNTFKSGKVSGLTWEEVRDIISRIEEKAPEPFRLVDRLMINLVDNYAKFTSQDLYFTVSAKANQGSVTESSGIIVFFINMTDRDDRSVNIRLTTDRNTIHPARQEVTMKLDKMTNPFPKEQPVLVGEGEDILSILAALLQVGDAVWFRVQPTGFGYRVVSIQAEEVDSNLAFGTTFEMRFTKKLSWYVKAYAPKLSAAGSLLIPFLTPLIA
ncbi:MAG: hypothetical protein IH840_16945 [Candidatus Heimdallarchaeota archaeon]|nr:hypothetical protein [Candidatus Heimdallarchaeota archaeon]